MRIRMKGIYKYWEGEFGKIRVLENVNLDIADKEFWPTIWEFYEKTLKPMEILKKST